MPYFKYPWILLNPYSYYFSCGTNVKKLLYAFKREIWICKMYELSLCKLWCDIAWFMQIFFHFKFCLKSYWIFGLLLFFVFIKHLYERNSYVEKRYIILVPLSWFVSHSRILFPLLSLWKRSCFCCSDF